MGGIVPESPTSSSPRRLGSVKDDSLDLDVVEGPGSSEAIDGEVLRPLPERRSAAELDAWRGEAKVVAIAVAGGLAAGAATVAAVSAVATRAQRRKSNRVLGRGKNARNVVASRSFLIDVHMLDR